jgi:AraC-like DNA-binding protein
MFLLDPELEKKRKEFGKSLVYSLLGIILFYNILIIILKVYFNFYTLAVSQILLIFCFFAISYVAYLVSKTQFNFFSFYRFIAFSFIVLLFYMGLQVGNKSSIIYVFYIPVVFLILIVTSIKKTAIIAFLLVIVCFFTAPISKLLNISQPIKPNKESVEILHCMEYIIIFFAIYLTFLMLYYKFEFYKIEIKQSKSADVCKPEFSENALVTQKTYIDNFEVLYERIIHYLENEKPYKNPNFNINILSKELKTNSSYASKALNKYGNKNFKNLVNEFRINQVKEDIANGHHKIYTVKFIYESAGFTQQSTFNRIFKEHTGKTPTEYIESVNNT